MKYRYGKFVPDLLDELDMDELMSKLSDLLLASGFRDPYFSGTDDERSMQALYDAILDALLTGGVLPDERLQQLLGEGGDEPSKQRVEELIKQIIERMQESGYVTAAPDLQADQARRQQRQGEQGQPERPARFEVTDKALDFLGFRALRDLLGSLGKSSFGRHDTRDLATGIEASGATKPYEFGDTLNLDASATLLNAIRRGLGRGLAPAMRTGARPQEIDLESEDLVIAQGEYQSSCATVIMLDCSHSMILYGEDRFTPAKRVAMALSQLIRLQYPGDSLKLVLFHDSAEEVPIAQLGRVRVGPYYTNTREGLRMARRLLERQRKDMRQIVMITDGKPSALTQPDGRIYRNAFGLDPLVVAETLREVANCRKAGIMINTFMLARDPDLVAFVRRVAAMCRGKAYFTTPYTLGQYVLMDYLDKKTRTIH
ncbi:MAG: VWA domain-containing protein [Vicinamibacteria bacterium]|nr:VWA domain-containing protein [Vicinamibacteria bacterium]